MKCYAIIDETFQIRYMRYNVSLQVHRIWMGRVGSSPPTFLLATYWNGTLAHPLLLPVGIIFGLAHPVWCSFRCPWWICFKTFKEQHIARSVFKKSWGAGPCLIWNAAWKKLDQRIILLLKSCKAVIRISKKRWRRRKKLLNPFPVEYDSAYLKEKRYK